LPPADNPGLPLLRWLHALMPKEERFFGLFARHSQAVLAGAEALRRMLDGGDAIAENFKIVMDREQDADNVKREVLIAVRRSRSGRASGAKADRRKIKGMIRPWSAGSVAPNRRSRMAVARPLAALLALRLLAGCAADYVPKEQPSFYRNLAQPGAQLDAAAAASMISGYRANNGLEAVALDPALMKLAEDQARAMVAKNQLDHDARRPFVARLKASGYDANTAAENIGAGYHTLAEAFSGWRDSAPHRANMLLKGATRIGIAAVYTPNSKYKVFWTLILAEPDERRG
jgi:uncharacterized protein YkwD